MYGQRKSPLSSYRISQDTERIAKLRRSTFIVNVTVHSSVEDQGDVKVTVHGPTGDLGSGTGQSGSSIVFNVTGAQLWSPASPSLYNMTITLGDDVVESYTGFRTIEKGQVDGITRHLLNGQVLFAFGTLE